MVSSMLTGEKRWVSARRGMTVLGKVTVPKPVNLPSQRLENRGLDPNVEIVPKGTLSWGSRTSSPASNAWGSSTSSPSLTDASTGSPSALVGHLSSGGAGTRPSTAGSERSHELVSSAWGPNSRPSSASGILAPNQTSALSSRPRSAETRSGSSYLSRFSETTTESSVAWGGPRTAEKLGTASSKHNGFTLRSGDFPSLGFEKSSESQARQGHSSHGRPASSDSVSQRERLGTTPTGDGPVGANEEQGDVNTWRREASLQTGGRTSNMEKWHRDLQQGHCYPNVSMPSHHFDPWHGAPFRSSPEGVWYRGGPPGGPYRPAVPPGGYPLESFGFYPPQLPSQPVANAQAGPRPGSSPNAYPPKNGDAYRAHTPDSYVVPSHPIIAVRPAFYPAPVPYDGCYGPPRMSFCNSNEQDAPPMGLAGGPYFCNPNQNVHPESGNFHFRPGGYGSGSMVPKDAMESTQPRNASQGPYKVLLKQHDSSGGNDAEEKRGTTQSHSDQDLDSRKPTDILKPTVQGSYSQLTTDQKEHAVPAVGCLPDSKVKVVDDGSVKKPETAANPPESPQQGPILRRNPAIIEKIEGLNSKARISEGWGETSSVSTREKTKQFSGGNGKSDPLTSDSANVVNKEHTSSDSPVLRPPREVVDASAQDKCPESTMGGIDMSKQVEIHSPYIKKMDSRDVGGKCHPLVQKRGPAMQGKPEFRGRGRFNNQDGEEWKRRPVTMDSSVISEKNTDACRDTHVHEHHSNRDSFEKQEIHLSAKTGGGLFMTSSLDSTDYQAQRAKRKEMAIERAKQLEKEEEERIKEQKAKALAKLEELNRRTLADNLTQKLENDLQPIVESLVSAAPESVLAEVSGCASGSKSDAIAQPESSNSKPMESLDCPLQGSTDPSVPASPDTNATESAPAQIYPQVNESNMPKQKQMVHKRKQHNSHEKSLGEKTTAIGGAKVHGNVVTNPNVSTFESGFGNNSSSNDDIPLQHKKKNGRSTKNRHKPDEVSVVDSSSAPSEGSSVKASDETVKPQITEASLDANPVQPQAVRDTTENRDPLDLSADQGWSQRNEACGRINNQWKPQHPRRMPRSAQTFRPAEKFHGNEGAVWAPVRPPPNKNEPSKAADTHVITDSAHSLGKNGYGAVNTSKGKRADIERYVPNPVAKELSHQDNSLACSQHPLSPIASEEVGGTTDYGSGSSTSAVQSDNSVVGIVDPAVERKIGESKYNKHGRTNVSWRQRGSAQTSVTLQNIHEDSSSLDGRKTTQKPVNQQQVYSPKGQAPKQFDNWNSNVPTSTESVTAPVTLTDHQVSGKGRRQSSKMHRVAGHGQIHGDDKDLGANLTNHKDSSASYSESIRVNGSSSRNENQSVGVNVSSHWQRKSRLFPTHSRHGQAGSGGQRIAVKSGGVPEKEFSSPVTTHVYAEEKHLQSQPLPNQPVTQKSIASIVTKSGRRVVDTSKDHSHVPNRSPPSSSQLAPEEESGDHKQQMLTSGQRRPGRHTGRFNGGQEGPYGVQGGSQGPENNRQCVPYVGDRWKHNSHYKYQPVGSFSKSNDSFHHSSHAGEEARDGARGMDMRYQEQGPSQSRRGGQFYGRSSGGAVGVGTQGNGK